MRSKTAKVHKSPGAGNSLRHVLALRDFRLLFGGVTTSLLGDQFALIATPWLVLQLTGDPLALGLVLALEGVPRALFMLFGGAVTDRFSPRIIMLASDLIRFLLTAAMAGAVFSGGIQIWMLYAFSLGFGLVAGFAVPAGNSIVPRLVEESDLQAGNSLIMGVQQFAGFAGPFAAGLLIGRYSESLLGVGLAFAVDCLTFGISALTLWRMRGGGQLPAPAQKGRRGSIWEEIADGLRFVGQDKALLLIFLLIAAVNFLFVGPILVGIPVLADQRLAGGAAAFGLLMSAFSGGSLAGFLLAGTLPRPGSRAMRWILISLLIVFGAALGLVGFSAWTWLDFLIMLMIGLGDGYVTIHFFTWIQSHTPTAMLGRIMSLVMLATAGLVPVSQAISGAVVSFDLRALFLAAGGLIILVAVLTALQPALVAFSESFAEQAHP